MNGHPASLGKFAVDLADQKLDFAAQVLIFPDVFPAWHHHLQQRDPMTQLWIAAQEYAEGLQALGNAFGVIHAVNAENHEIVGQFAAQLGRCCFYFMAFGVVRELIKRDADRESGDSCPAVVQANNVLGVIALRRCFWENSLHTIEEIETIAVSLKSEQMIIEQGTEDVLTAG